MTMVKMNSQKKCLNNNWQIVLFLLLIGASLHVVFGCPYSWRVIVGELDVNFRISSSRSDWARILRVRVSSWSECCPSSQGYGTACSCTSVPVFDTKQNLNWGVKTISGKNTFYSHFEIWRAYLVGGNDSLIHTIDAVEGIDFYFFVNHYFTDHKSCLRLWNIMNSTFLKISKAIQRFKTFFTQLKVSKNTTGDTFFEIEKSEKVAQ